MYPGTHTIWISYRSAISPRYLRQPYTVLEFITLKLRALIEAWLSVSIWSFQRMQGRPLRRLPPIPASNTRLSGASSSIRTTWPSQRSRWILIRCTSSMSLRSSYSSLLNRMRKSSPTRTGPKILRRTFLSNTLKAAASVLNNVYASAP